MPEKYLEENRFLFIDSPLGPNELLLESFTGREGISQLFSFQLELLSENRKIRFDDILGREISFGVAGAEEDEEPRHIHGLVTSFAQLPDTARLAHYHAAVAPRPWILTQKQNCRIFQNLTVPEILTKIFYGIDFVLELQGSHPKREYCVQYRETDFNFASRLMEEEGIFYFFRFSKTSHKLVLADSPTSNQDMPGQSSLIYDEVSGGLREEARVSSWAMTQELGLGKYTLRDYFFEKPKLNLEVSEDILPSTTAGRITHKLKVGGNEQFEVYDYPGGYDNPSYGKNIAKLGVEQREMPQFAIRGESNVFTLTPGYRFSLTHHQDSDGPYILTVVTHSASEGGFHSGSRVGENHYGNVFHAIPIDFPFRPQANASRPHVWGCQTAVVVGPSGEEIFTDEHGRVKVQFHWDREGKNNESSSCWIRFATHWAGAGWGTIYIPRIGQEVVVDFLEGDPDRPIIVGSVYNGSNTPPFPLPADKTKSGIKSMSSKGGGGYNQITFEDLKGKEDIVVHAQKDMHVAVENDRITAIGHDDNIKISHDCTVEVDNNFHTEVGENRTIKAGKEIVLETGSAKIVMKASGSIEISGTTINITGSSLIKAESSGNHVIKGNPVMIN